MVFFLMHGGDYVGVEVGQQYVPGPLLVACWRSPWVPKQHLLAVPLDTPEWPVVFFENRVGVLLVQAGSGNPGFGPLEPFSGATHPFYNPLRGNNLTLSAL